MISMGSPAEANDVIVGPSASAWKEANQPANKRVCISSRDIPSRESAIKIDAPESDYIQ